MSTIKLHTISRDDLYEATATYNKGEITVDKGSRINIVPGEKYLPTEGIKSIRSDKTIVDENGVLLKEVTFSSLSTVASFVQGRIANGMIFWKTDDGKYVRNTIREK